ncbi:MAG: two-component sensor histidine kinase, partial [Bacilli bacterium]|nr:two-component sensor histidine kinase [Bacilli bacterium]
IPVNELMERFKRGDESRSSEGSGLGLAIAGSLMEVQGGSLELSIDGDLFKAEINLKKY